MPQRKDHKQSSRTHRSPYDERSRERLFNNRYSLTDKTHRYEALEDPYTSYYFANRSVKQHLKGMKKALKREKNNETEKSRMGKLITMRIHERYEGFANPKTSLYSKVLKQDAFGELEDASLHTLQTRSRKSVDLRKERGNPRKTSGLPAIRAGLVSLNTDSKENLGGVKTEDGREDGPPRQTDKEYQKRKTAKLSEELHEQRHKKWVLFLEEKKKLLQTQYRSESVPPK